MSKFLLFFFLLPITQTFAQNYKVDWGPTYSRKGMNASEYKFLGLHDDNYFMIMDPQNDNTIKTYDLNHQEILEYDFEHIRNKTRLGINGAVQTKSGTYLYMHQFSEKYKEWIIHASKKINNRFVEPKEVCFHNLENLDKGQLKSGFLGYQYQWGAVKGDHVISQDSSKVAFIKFFERNRKKNDDIVAISVFDDQMQLLWKDVFYYQFGDKNATINQQRVTNDGEIYLVGESEKNRSSKIRSKKSKNLPEEVFTIYHINQEGILSQDVVLDKGKAPIDVGLYFPNNNTDQYLMAGLYTTDEFSSGRINGVFFTYGDRDFTEHEIKIHEFEDEFIKGLVSNKALKKGKGLNARYRLKDMLEYDNGTIGFIAEETYTRTNTTYTDQFGRTAFGAGGFGTTRQVQITYFTNNIIIPKFDSQGNMLNIQRVDKTFASLSQYNTSYSLAINKGKAYLVFNDTKSRSEKKDMGKKGRRFTDLVVIGEDGAIETRETLFSDREIDLEFTTYFSGYNDEYMLIGSTWRRKYAMGTIKFD
ncbi:MAG: hypothetical protein HKO66_06695 [Saprospiraceae bacterium]|nr:hypothetical protein [Saprospiraceae bacterium]NNL91901.1 hypothetical protein [Saprospiraceae bacterium]